MVRRAIIIFLTIIIVCWSTTLSVCQTEKVGKKHHLPPPKKVLHLMEKVADWQLANPTGKKLNSWDYAPFYMGLMELYHLNGEEKYLSAIMEMGEKVNWEPRARPYDANVLAISQVFLELYEMTGEKYMIDKSRFVMDAPMMRWLEPEVHFEGNKYWWEWWTWCDALFMAPPAYAMLAKVKNEPKYREFMVKKWWRTSDYLYSEADSLFFRDDRFFDKQSENGAKVFWSRGNGWVVGGLARLLDYLPTDHPERKKFEQQFVEMCQKLAHIQMENGFWSSSLLDPEHYPYKETSGTAFFVFAMAWGINQGLLSEAQFLPVIKKSWEALVSAVGRDGKLGYVQRVGDAPEAVKAEDSESYGSGAFLLAGSELYRLLDKKR